VSARRPRFDSSINYYQVLDVPAGATKEEITRAYRRLMRLTHPDHFSDPEQRAKAEERAKLINAAYSVLSKPSIRQEYDGVLRHTAMTETLMQRYTGNVPGRPSGTAPRPAPRPPSAHVVRAQKAAYTSAVRQLMLVMTGAVIGLIVVIVLGVLAAQAIQALL
jgi:curved DNA-binding protein CbpA